MIMMMERINMPKNIMPTIPTHERKNQSIKGILLKILHPFIMIVNKLIKVIASYIPCNYLCTFISAQLKLINL